jgi:hypothetical protein
MIASLLPLSRHMVLAPSNLLQLRPTQSFARVDGGRWMLLLPGSFAYMCG